MNGLCDAAMTLVARLFHKLPVNEALQSYAGAACDGLDHVDVSLSAQNAVVAHCYEECMNTMESRSEDSLLCYKMQQVNQTKFYEDVIAESKQCAGLPYTHLEDLLEFKLQQKCWTFAPPSPVWLTNDQSIGDISKACTATKSWMHRTADLVDGQRCPAGTMCQCPGPSFYPKTTAEIRKAHSSTFVTDGDAGVVSVSNYIARQALFYSVPELIIRSGAVLWAGGDLKTATAEGLVAALKFLQHDIFFRLEMSIAILGHAYSVATWRCVFTVACWPVSPRRVRKTVAGSRSACRAKDKVRAMNGGATWMMPPPGLKYKKGLLRCKLESCTAEEMAVQKVGFGNDAGFHSPSGQSEVYNCQPLAWEEMSLKQRVEYLSILSNTGVSKEYDLSPALDESRKALVQSPAA